MSWRWITVVALVFLAARSPGVTRADDPPALLQQQNWMKFHIAIGRIRAEPRSPVQRTVKTNKSGEGRSETLQIIAGPQGHTLVYERVVENRRTEIRLDQVGECLIRQEVQEASGSTVVEYEQKPKGPVIHRRREGGDVQIREAESLWHLALEHREPFQQEIAPLLGLLFSTPWDEQIRQLELSLIEPDRIVSWSQRQIWISWVNELGDERFAQREDADRRLRKIGPVAWPILKLMNRQGLDAEQRRRLARIVEGLELRRGAETPQLAADWLAYDEGVWLELLTREDPVTRKRAKEQLERLLGRSIAFDPAASTLEREVQLIALREQLEPAP